MYVLEFRNDHNLCAGKTPLQYVTGLFDASSRRCFSCMQRTSLDMHMPHNDGSSRYLNTTQAHVISYHSSVPERCIEQGWLSQVMLLFWPHSHVSLQTTTTPLHDCRWTLPRQLLPQVRRKANGWRERLSMHSKHTVTSWMLSTVICSSHNKRTARNKMLCNSSSGMRDVLTVRTWMR